MSFCVQIALSQTSVDIPNNITEGIAEIKLHENEENDNVNNNKKVTMDTKLQELNEHVNYLNDLPQISQLIQSNDRTLQMEATVKVRRLLSVEKNMPIQEVIDAGLIPRFVTFLTFDHDPELQFESEWILTNIAYGNAEQTQELIKHDAVRNFVHLLKSSNKDVREQAVWALGNISGESTKLRDLVLQQDVFVLSTVLKFCTEKVRSRSSMRSIATWTLSNLMKGKPQPEFEKLKQTLPVFRTFDPR